MLDVSARQRHLQSYRRAKCNCKEAQRGNKTKRTKSHVDRSWKHGQDQDDTRKLGFQPTLFLGTVRGPWIAERAVPHPGQPVIDTTAYQACQNVGPYTCVRSLGAMLAVRVRRAQWLGLVVIGQQVTRLRYSVLTLQSCSYFLMMMLSLNSRITSETGFS